MRKNEYKSALLLKKLGEILNILVIKKNISQHNYIKKLKEARVREVVPVVMFKHLQTPEHK